MKIIHFISGLKSGGTERNLFKIVTQKKTKDIIFSFLKSNFYFKNQKIKIYFPEKNSFLSILKHFLSIPKILKIENPNVIYCWMIHANVLGGLISYFFGYKKIIWNIRSSGDESRIFKKNYFIFKILIILSYFIPKKTIFNSNYSQSNYRKRLFNKKNNQLIYNGFEKKIFKKKQNHAPIKFLYVARNHAIKNHLMLLKAFHEFDEYFNDWKLVLVGRDIHLLKKRFKKMDFGKKTLQKITFYNEVKNLNKFYRSAHFHVLSSHAESFPNVIGESMSYGTPNIAVNVGDVKKLILNKNFLAISNNSKEFCKSLIHAKKLFFNSNKYVSYCKKNHEHINKNFSNSKMVNQFKKTERFISYKN